MSVHSHNCSVAARAVATAEGVYSLCLRKAGRDTEAQAAEERQSERLCERLAMEDQQ